METMKIPNIIFLSIAVYKIVFIKKKKRKMLKNGSRYFPHLPVMERLENHFKNKKKRMGVIKKK